MNLNTYYSLKNADKSTLNYKRDLVLANGPFYDRTVEDFYKDCIEIDHGKTKWNDTIKNWSQMLYDYIDMNNPIYWIRKYESGKKIGTSNIQDNRRGALTLVIDKDEVLFSYAFVSNFDAQEICNMIRLGVDVPDIIGLQKSLINGTYQMHYNPSGSACCDNEISYFENTGSVQAGIINYQNWYLAHIYDVNGIGYKNLYSLNNAQIEDIFFPLGEVKDWRNVIDISSKYAFLKNILNNDQIRVKQSKQTIILKRKVRVIEIDDVCDKFQSITGIIAKKSEIIKLYKDLLVAHFLRFVHPYNYFLVPSKKAEVNSVLGNKDKSIGEILDVINYVRDCNAKKYGTDYKEFENKIMLPDNLNNDFDKKKQINIYYGSHYVGTIKLPERVKIVSKKKVVNPVFTKSPKSRSVLKINKKYSTSSSITKLKKVLIPSDIEIFTKNLIVNQKITMEIYYIDGTVIMETWNAKNIKDSEKLKNNMNSRIGHRIDKDKIIKVIFKV